MNKTTFLNNFQDPALSDSMLICDLIDAIKPGSIQYNLLKTTNTPEVRETVHFSCIDFFFASLFRQRRIMHSMRYLWHEKSVHPSMPFRKISSKRNKKCSSQFLLASWLVICSKARTDFSLCFHLKFFTSLFDCIPVSVCFFFL